MHMVFLLAYGHANTPKMLQLGKKLIEEYYTGDDINMHYTSDLDTPVFKHLDFRPEDSGKYTGETVLHIAIVNKDLETGAPLCAVPHLHSVPCYAMSGSVLRNVRF